MSAGGGTECTAGEIFGFECDTCLHDACCDQATACIEDFDGGGEQCFFQGTGAFNPDGQLIDDLLDCLEANCLAECGSVGICGTGLSTTYPDVDACIDDNCCDDFVACFGADGENIEACNDCIEAGGGALCAGYLTCLSDNGCG